MLKREVDADVMTLGRAGAWLLIIMLGGIVLLAMGGL